MALGTPGRSLACSLAPSPSDRASDRADRGVTSARSLAPTSPLAEDRCPQNHCIRLEHVHDHVSHQHANEVCHDYNLKSGDELISLMETFGLCEGRAEQHYYISVRAT